MADGQRVVGDEALGERQLVSVAGLFRLREVIGEVGADELLSGDTVTLTVASLTSVILPSGLMVTRGSRLASIRLRAY